MSAPRARAATIRRATLLARRQLQEFTDQQLEVLRASYQRTVSELAELIEQAAGDGSDVRLAALRLLMARIQARLDALSDRTAAQINGALATAAEYGTEALLSYAQPQALLEAAQDAVRHVQTFRAADGLQLSDRIWRLGAAQRRQIGELLESAIIQGASASEAALQYVNAGRALPRDLLGQQQRAHSGRLVDGVRSLLTGADATNYRNALRVFRTEINRAHGEAYARSLGELEGVAGVRFKLSPNHPRPDICDLHAAVNRYGLGDGVYPRDRHPWPAHPETLSFLEVVFEDEVQDADRKGRETRIEWLKRQPPVIQEAVLGSRKKRAALVEGHLTEQQIATPWSTLKERYERQGIDTKAMGSTLRAVAANATPAAGNPIRAIAAVDPDIRATVTRALDAVVQVHGVGRLPEVPVVVNNLEGAELAEGYMLPQRGRVREIAISRHALHPEHTFLHEFGHYLDHQGIGAPGTFATNGNPVMAGVMAALDSTQAVATIRRNAGMAPGHAAYLLNRQELWARAYAQWVTLRSGERTLRRQLDGIIRLTGSGLPAQWQWADFDPVATAIDNMMRSIGWVQ